MAAEDFLRRHLFAFKEDTILRAGLYRICELAVHSAERGEGGDIIIFAPEIAESTESRFCT